MTRQHILVIGVGGLGQCLVREGLERELHVSVLVRNKEKLLNDLGEATVTKLDHIHVGDGMDPAILDKAMRNVNVVLSGRGADPRLAHEMARAVKRNGIAKLCWPAGSTNVMAEDGITPNYKNLLHLGKWVEQAYTLHGACIDTIKETGINHVIFCPGRMGSAGHRSPDVASTIRINRDAGPFVSYEDAAWVLLEAATTDTYDRQLVSAATPN